VTIHYIFDSQIFLRYTLLVYGKNDFAEGSKILLNTDLKIILLDHRNKFVGTLKTVSNAKNSST